MNLTFNLILACYDASVQPGMWGGTSAVLAPPPDLAFAQQVLMLQTPTIVVAY